MSLRFVPRHPRWLLAGLFFATTVGAATVTVATFECISVYHATAEPATCHVHYRPAGTDEWRPALDLVYDPRDQEHRGSIVGLQPDTAYEVRVTQLGRDHVVSTRTRSDQFPIGETSFVGSRVEPLEITVSGTPEGYHLVTPHPDTRTTIDVANQADDTIVIDADYVVVRGLELRNAARHGIYIKPGRHHVVIEDCRITFWGRIGGPITFGNSGNMDSAIYADRGAGDLVLQRNLIENPRGAANDWDTGHPSGPQGITLVDSSGRNVIRYNEIVSTEDHGFNDAIGGASNFSDAGSANRDSDIHGNFIGGVWDDGIESEGANMNVRIWGNYLHRVYQHVATASTSKGPLYVFRNVFGSSRKTQRGAPGGAMIKTGTRGEVGGGRKFIFHNTALQPHGAFLVFSGRSDPNTVTRNNIFDTPGRLAPAQLADPPGDYDYDLFTGNDLGVAQEPQGVRARRVDYLASPYLEFYPAAVTTTVQYGKIPVSRGGATRVITDPVVTIPNPAVDGGAPLPNFNDDFAGRAPDIGAFELGRPPLRFGRRAVDDVWAPWELHAAEVRDP